MANEFAVPAFVGRRAIMALGGLRGDKERVFLLPPAHPENHSLPAVIETMRICKRGALGRSSNLIHAARDHSESYRRRFARFFHRRRLSVV
jgi:hypothetical protein